MARRVRDEHERFARPSKHGSRPRSKQRPDHADAVTGLVTGVDRGRYTLVVDDGGPDEREILAMKARELSRTRAVVGDRVDVVGDVSGDDGTLARIVRIQERTAVLRRTADDTDPYERIVVANADQLVVVVALAQPEPRTGMIDRCVVAAYDAGMDVLLCLTKADLAPADDLFALYEPIGVQVVVTRRDDPAAVEAVRERLLGRTSVLVGHSGVGKSTLINALVPAAGRATGVVNDVTGRGRHTSTSAVALRLPVAGQDAGGGTAHDGWVIDTPGVRSFGLAHVETDHLLRAFEDLDAAAQECPRGCTHAADAPDCALDDWVAAADDEPGRAGRAARLGSFRRLLSSRTAAD
ncbi:ribosome small subunit-dependent GTPase A [Isoptericola aurantiacus]|uniref:ribosome small subunit-dependent GTPase A n=1 Tax=Isoptericola aurantiacus TaxID=3377839 RepID=UPI00383A787D